MTKLLMIWAGSLAFLFSAWQPTTSSKTLNTNTTTTLEAETPSGLSHGDWDDLLRTHVSSSGSVNYEGFKKDKTKLIGYIKKLAMTPPGSSWSKNEQMAYWINLYNACMVNIVVEKYPISSVLKIDNGKVWTTRKLTVGTKSYTLDQVEKEKLIRAFNEPRVHFAVNCAAKSCPPLMNRAWTADNIQKNFESRAKSFINNSKYNEIGENSVEISKIFEWYKADFGGDLIKYLNKYSNTPIKSNAKIVFKDYNWDLNK